MSKTSGRFDPGPAGVLLASAWRSGELLTELPAEIRPRTMTEGYDVQDRLIAELGLACVGWKLGVGSVLQKRTSGVGRSIAGRILSPNVHRTGDTVLLPNAAPVTIEFEIAYILGRDILPGEPEPALRDAIAEVRVAFELVLSRFVDRRAVGWPSFAADNAAFQTLVLGDAVPPDRLDDLVTSLVVTADGDEAARALRGEDATDPEAALADLVAVARERGMPLPKDSIISTGTLSKPFTIAAPSTTIRAGFLGEELHFRTRVLARRGEAARLGQ